MLHEWHTVENESNNIFIYDHHYQLINRFNALLQKCRSTSSIEAIGNYLEYLKDYVVHYFELEEHGMIAYKYPLFNYHKAEHELFKELVNQQYQEYLTHGVNPHVFAETVHWSGEWLINHVYKADQTMVVYLNDRTENSSQFFN